MKCVIFCRKRGKVYIMAEYSVLYFAESGNFAIFAARYKYYEYNNRKKK